MESIKCSAKDIDIYIFLPARSALELAELSHVTAAKTSQDPAWTPSLASSTHNFLVTAWDLVASSRAAAAESTGCPTASEPHHRDDDLPHHFSHVSFRKSPLSHAHFYTLRGQGREKAGMLTLAKLCLLAFLSFAFCLKKETDSSRGRLGKLVKIVSGGC